MTRSLFVAPLVGLVVVFASGCGSATKDSSSSSGGTRTLNVTQTVSKKANDVQPASIEAQAQRYYLTHAGKYTTAASRDVRHILVNSKALADKLEQQLKSGSDFAELAKEYSKDPGSASLGGKLTVSKGQTVAGFDKVAFSLKTGQISPPVHTQYGWHLIQALSPVRPGRRTPFSAVRTQIIASLQRLATDCRQFKGYQLDTVPAKCLTSAQRAKVRVARQKAEAFIKAHEAKANAWHRGYYQQDSNVFWRWRNLGYCRDDPAEFCWTVEVITRNGCPSYVAVNANEYDKGAVVNQLLDNQDYGIPPTTPRIFYLGPPDYPQEAMTINVVSVDCQ
jgi:hypothetical protein